MATYQSGTDPFTVGDNWSESIGSILEPGVSSNVFYIQDVDGAETEVTGTGFTYNANQTAVTGGTITEVQKFLPDGPSGLSGEQISGLSLDAATFWNASTGAQKFADLLSGDDTFVISTPITANFATGLPYALNGYGGSNVLNLENDNDGLELNFLSSTSAQLVDLQGSQNPMPVSNFSTFVCTGGLLVNFPGSNTSYNLTFSNLTFNDVGNAEESLGEVVESFQFNSSNRVGVLDLSTDRFAGPFEFIFEDQGSGLSFAEVKLGSANFPGGLYFDDDDGGAVSDTVDIVMTSASFNGSNLQFDTSFTTAPNIIIDGSASSSNLTIVGSPLSSTIFGGSGNDTITGAGASAADYIYGSLGNDTIKAGSKGADVDYGKLAIPGLTVIYQGTSGTVKKGGANGTDQLTNIQQIFGSTGSDVFYVDHNTVVTGNGGFDYLIELTAGTTITYGTQFTGISEIVSNTGNNTIDLTGDTSIGYLYGSTGNDTLTLGSGGGYLFGEGGINTLTGGNFATNIFEGGAGTNDMLGGVGNTAANYYYVGSNDTVEGSGGFNAVIELVSGVSVVLGNGQYTDIQEFVADGGNNTAVVSSVEADFVYLYGGAGNDTLSTSKGGGYLIGEGGTNTLNGGSGTNVFVADGASGVDTMNGGIGSNIYIVDSHSTVHGAGTFNTVEELQQNASLTLGSASLTGVQQVVFAGGTNSADFHTATSSVYLYGGSDSDTLFGGTGNDFLYGGAGANTFEFGQGWGKDTIEDWTAGTNSIIDLTALASLGVHAVTDLTQTISGGHDTITSSHTGTNSITLLGVGSALTASSFHFA